MSLTANYAINVHSKQYAMHTGIVRTDGTVVKSGFEECTRISCCCPKNNYFIMHNFLILLEFIQSVCRQKFLRYHCLMSSQTRLSVVFCVVCRLSVTFVHPTQRVELFANTFASFALCNRGSDCYVTVLHHVIGTRTVVLQF